jgi:hypothetical protein
MCRIQRTDEAGYAMGTRRGEIKSMTLAENKRNAV